MKKPILAFLISAFLLLLVLNNLPLSIEPVFGAYSISAEILPNLIRTGETYVLNDRVVFMDNNTIVEKGGVLILNNVTLTVVLARVRGSPPFNLTIKDGGQLQVTGPSTKLPEIRTASRTGKFIYISFEGKSSGSFVNVRMKSTTLLLKGSAVVSAYNLQMDDTSQPGQIFAQDSSSLTISNSRISPPSFKSSLTLQKSSTVSLSRTTASDINITGASRLFVSDVQTPTALIGTIRTYDASTLVVRNSSNGWSLETRGTSSALVLGLQLRNATAYGASMISIFKTTLVSLKVYDNSVGLVNGATVTSLSSHDNSRLNIIDTKVDALASPKGGSVEAYGFSDVSISGSNLRELGAHDSSTFSIYGSAVEWVTRSSSSSTLSVANSNMTILSVNDNSKVTATKSQISLLSIDKFSSVNLSNSTIGEAILYFNYVNASFKSLTPKLYTQWNSFVNGSLALNPNGYAPNLTLKRTRVTQGWSLWFSARSNVSMVDSAIRFLGAYDSAVMELVNTTTLSYDIKSEATVYVYWYLDVYALSGTNLTVFYNGATIGPTITVDSNGFARFMLLEKTITPSGVDARGPYTLSTAFNGSAEQRSVEMTGDKTIDLIPPVPFTQQLLSLIMSYWYLIVGLAFAAIVVILMSLRLRRKRKLQALSNS